MTKTMKMPINDDGVNPPINDALTRLRADKNMLDKFRGILNEEHGYLIDDQFGSGGFGSVYNLLDKNSMPLYDTDRRFVLCLKIPRLEHESGEFKPLDKHDEKYIKREVELAKIFIHERNRHILHIDKTGCVDIDDISIPYIIMKKYEGSLSDFKRFVSVMNYDDVLRVGLHITKALQAIHEKGIVHRDIKPQNLLFEIIDGKYNFVIADFGISRMSRDDTPLSTDSKIYAVGTEAFSDVRINKTYTSSLADLASLGFTLYWCCTGFPSKHEMEMFRNNVLNNTHLKPENVSNELWKIITRAIHENTTKRYKTANKMHKALKEIYDKRIPGKKSSRNFWYKLIIAINFLTIAIFLVILQRNGSVTENDPNQFTTVPPPPITTPPPTPPLTTPPSTPTPQPTPAVGTLYGYEYDNGRWERWDYTGYILDALPHGIGKKVFINGSYFEGHFYRGAFVDGSGLRVFNDNTRLRVRFRNEHLYWGSLYDSNRGISYTGYMHQDRETNELIFDGRVRRGEDGHYTYGYFDNGFFFLVPN